MALLYHYIYSKGIKKSIYEYEYMNFIDLRVKEAAKKANLPLHDVVYNKIKGFAEKTPKDDGIYSVQWSICNDDDLRLQLFCKAQKIDEGGINFKNLNLLREQEKEFITQYARDIGMLKDSASFKPKNIEHYEKLRFQLFKNKFNRKKSTNTLDKSYIQNALRDRGISAYEAKKNFFEKHPYMKEPNHAGEFKRHQKEPASESQIISFAKKNKLRDFKQSVGPYVQSLIEDFLLEDSASKNKTALANNDPLRIVKFAMYKGMDSFDINEKMMSVLGGAEESFLKDFAKAHLKQEIVRTFQKNDLKMLSHILSENDYNLKTLQSNDQIKHMLVSGEGDHKPTSNSFNSLSGVNKLIDPDDKSFNRYVNDSERVKDKSDYFKKDYYLEIKTIAEENNLLNTHGAVPGYVSNSLYSFVNGNKKEHNIKSFIHKHKELRLTMFANAMDYDIQKFDTQTKRHLINEEEALVKAFAQKIFETYSNEDNKSIDLDYGSYGKMRHHLVINNYNMDEALNTLEQNRDMKMFVHQKNYEADVDLTTEEMRHQDTMDKILQRYEM